MENDTYDDNEDGEDRDTAHVILAQYIKPILFLLGLLGNILSIAVLRRNTFRNSTSVYLFLLAVVSLVYIVFYFPFIFKEYVTEGSDTYVYVMISYQCYIGLFILDSASFSAYWMTAIVAIERCIVVGLPLKSRLFCRRKYAWITCGILFVVALLLNIPRCLECRPVSVEDPESSMNITVEMELVKLPGFNSVSHALGMSIVQSLIPFCIAFVSNIVLLTLMIRKWMNTKHLSADGKVDESRINANAAQKRAITILVLSNLGLYLLSQTLANFLYIKAYIKGFSFYNEMIDESIGFYSNTLSFTFFCFSSLTYLIISSLYRKIASRVIMEVFSRTHTYTTNFANSVMSRKNQTRSHVSSRGESVNDKTQHTVSQVEDSKV